MMMMKSVFWWRKPEDPEEITNLRKVTDETFHTYSLCPVRGLNLDRSGVKQSKLRHDAVVREGVWDQQMALPSSVSHFKEHGPGKSAKCLGKVLKFCLAFSVGTMN